MPLGGFPKGTVLATDPLGARVNNMLRMLDEALVLAFNMQAKHFEVWRKELTSLGVFYGPILPVVGDKGEFVEPGEWLIRKLKARDGAYAGPAEAINNVLADIRKSEAAALAADQKRDDDATAEVAQEIALDHTLEAQLKSDPHITGRRRYTWNPETTRFGQAGSQKTTKGREAIREEGKRDGKKT